jgi:phospholipid/cholesterol/gamma-HCH transport system ATP-binding protein
MAHVHTHFDGTAASGNASPVISVRNLRMGYGTRLLLDDASFDVARAEVLVILGGSGSGKSSLMKSIIGLYRPMAGDILIDGASIVIANADERERLQRRLGVMYRTRAARCSARSTCWRTCAFRSISSPTSRWPKRI